MVEIRYLSDQVLLVNQPKASPRSHVRPGSVTIATCLYDLCYFAVFNRPGVYNEASCKFSFTLVGYELRLGSKEESLFQARTADRVFLTDKCMVCCKFRVRSLIIEISSEYLYRASFFVTRAPGLRSFSVRVHMIHSYSQSSHDA